VDALEEIGISCPCQFIHNYYTDYTIVAFQMSLMLPVPVSELHDATL
jgi:hypothetical protein